MGKLRLNIFQTKRSSLSPPLWSSHSSHSSLWPQAWLAMLGADHTNSTSFRHSRRRSCRHDLLSPLQITRHTSIHRSWHLGFTNYRNMAWITLPVRFSTLPRPLWTISADRDDHIPPFSTVFPFERMELPNVIYAMTGIGASAVYRLGFWKVSVLWHDLNHVCSR